MSARISSALTVLAVSTLLEGPLLHAQARELRVYISADMEGVGGVVGEQQASKGGSEYESFRELMTAEVNAAVEAALEAGASEVVVSDSHGGGQNLLVSKLHPEARLVRSFPRSLDMMHGIDESFDAALFIGYHAAAWQPGVLAHTMNGRHRGLHGERHPDGRARLQRRDRRAFRGAGGAGDGRPGGDRGAAEAGPRHRRRGGQARLWPHLRDDAASDQGAAADPRAHPLRPGSPRRDPAVRDRGPDHAGAGIQELLHRRDRCDDSDRRAHRAERDPHRPFPTWSPRPSSSPS